MAVSLPAGCLTARQGHGAQRGVSDSDRLRQSARGRCPDAARPRPRKMFARVGSGGPGQCRNGPPMRGRRYRCLQGWLMTEGNDGVDLRRPVWGRLPSARARHGTILRFSTPMERRVQVVRRPAIWENTACQARLSLTTAGDAPSSQTHVMGRDFRWRPDRACGRGLRRALSMRLLVQDQHVDRVVAVVEIWAGLQIDLRISLSPGPDSSCEGRLACGSSTTA